MNSSHEPRKLGPGQTANARSLGSLSELPGPSSGFSMSLSEATIGVSQDRLGDWTIAVGLSQRSERYLRVVTSLENLGFFQATENEGTAFLLWTSLFSEVGDVRVTVEQTLAEALKILQTSIVPHYIG